MLRNRQNSGTRTCLQCGISYEVIAVNQQYCHECSKFRYRAQSSTKYNAMLKEGRIDEVRALMEASDAKRAEKAAERAKKGIVCDRQLAEETRQVRREVEWVNTSYGSDAKVGTVCCGFCSRKMTQGIPCKCGKG